MTADPFTETLNQFCADLSEKIAVCAECDDDPGMDQVVGSLLDGIRQAMANLMLCELECERLLHRG